MDVSEMKYKQKINEVAYLSLGLDDTFQYP